MTERNQKKTERNNPVAHLSYIQQKYLSNTKAK